MTVEMLELVDENDVVIGTAPRKEIHQKGLLHREVNVMFITPAGDIVFQRRSKTKDTFPDLLDATAGGHVEIGDSYDVTAVKEIAEETGLDVSIDDLVLLEMVRSDKKDSVTHMRNNCHRAIYGYIFRGKVSDLVMEAGAGEGFELHPVKNMFSLPDDLKKEFIDRYTEPASSAVMYKKLQDMIEK